MKFRETFVIMALMLLPALSTAQMQRIALLAGKFSIAAKGRANPPSLCLDEAWAAPSAGTSYGSLLTPESRISVKYPGEPPMPIAAALSKGRVAMRGAGGGANYLDLINLFNKPAEVYVKDPAIFWTGPSTFKNPRLLEELRKVGARSDLDAAQDLVWEATSRHYENLGIIKGLGYPVPDARSLDVRTYDSAVRKFQKDVGLPPDGATDRLETAAQVGRGLQDLGYWKGASEGQRLSEAIRAFEAGNGLPASGRLTTSLERALSGRRFQILVELQRLGIGVTDRTIAPALSKYRQTFALPETMPLREVQAQLSHDATLAQTTFARLRVANYAFLERAPDNVLALSRPSMFERRCMVRTLRGIETWDLSGRSIQRFGGKRAITELAEGEASVSASNSTGEVGFVYFGPMDASGLADSFIQAGESRIVAKPARIKRFLAGEEGFPELASALANKKAVVLLRDAFAQGAGPLESGRTPRTDGGSSWDGFYHPEFDHVDPHLALARLRAFLGDKHEVWSSNSVLYALRNQAALPPVGAGKNVVAYFGKEVQLHDIDSLLKPDLEEVGIRVETGIQAFPEAQVAVCFGHHDATFRDYLDRLGERGAFQGKVVALETCHAPGSEALNSKLVQEYGAKAVLFYPEKIDPEAVRSVCSMLAERLRSQPAANIESLLKDAIEGCLAASPPPQLVPELEKMKSGSVQRGRR